VSWDGVENEHDSSSKPQKLVEGMGVPTTLKLSRMHIRETHMLL